MILPNHLETKRLILRPFRRDDFRVFSNLLKDPEVSENLKFVLKTEIEQNIKNLFQSVITFQNTSEAIYALVITHKETSDSIGSCGLIYLEENNETICFYSLLPRYRGHGFAIEAMKKLIEYAFLKLNLSKLTIYINPKNKHSWKVAERTGMKYLGQVELSNISSKAMIFSIEKREFKAQQLY
ncbi:MAG: GNAT family N-acetyltransferase [Candidatus Hodarchaeota archaeon]